METAERLQVGAILVCRQQQQQQQQRQQPDVRIGASASRQDSRDHIGMCSYKLSDVPAAAAVLARAQQHGISSQKTAQWPISVR
jgi:hypothetical protein